jgi:predicted transposase/invertase (TIGR01784 family)
MTGDAPRKIFADPKLDVPFKKIFGTVEHKNLLIELLNALLELSGDTRIVDLEYLAREQLPPLEGLKLSILDVKCRDAAGTRYVVEMQVFPVPGFQKRVVLNACKAYVQQLNSGDGYSSLSDVIAVSICNFALWPDTVPMLSRWYMREERSGARGLSQLSYVFLELPKYAGNKPQTAVDKWAYFFRETAHLHAVPEELSEPPYTEALEAVRRIHFTDTEWLDYERSKMAEEDFYGGLTLAHDRGMEKGIEQGIEQGRRATLLTLLEQRFGELSDRARVRVSAAGPDELDAWTARVLTATSLKELLD